MASSETRMTETEDWRDAKACAHNWDLWAEYIDPFGAMSYEQWLTVPEEERAEIALDVFQKTSK